MECLTKIQTRGNKEVDKLRNCTNFDFWHPRTLFSHGTGAQFCVGAKSLDAGAHPISITLYY